MPCFIAGAVHDCSPLFSEILLLAHPMNMIETETLLAVFLWQKSKKNLVSKIVSSCINVLHQSIQFEAASPVQGHLLGEAYPSFKGERWDTPFYRSAVYDKVFLNEAKFRNKVNK